MTSEAPALIQYACERCKTRFVLPASSRKLGLGGKFRAMSSGVGRTVRHHEGLGGAYDTAKRQLLAKMDDEAYQAFVQSFRFCHECRQFVCNECWSTSRRSCLTCVAKSMAGEVRPRPPFAPAGPEIPRPVAVARPARNRKLRRDATIAALVIAVALLGVEGGMLLIYAASPARPVHDDRDAHADRFRDTDGHASGNTDDDPRGHAGRDAGPGRQLPRRRPRRRQLRPPLRLPLLRRRQPRRQSRRRSRPRRHCLCRASAAATVDSCTCATSTTPGATRALRSTGTATGTPQGPEPSSSSRWTAPRTRSS